MTSAFCARKRLSVGISKGRLQAAVYYQHPTCLYNGKIGLLFHCLMLLLAKEVDYLFRYKLIPVSWTSVKQNTSKALPKLRGMAVLGGALGWSSSSACSQVFH